MEKTDIKKVSMPFSYITIYYSVYYSGNQGNAILLVFHNALFLYF